MNRMQQEPGARPGAGPSTEQNVTLSPESGEFITDKPPAADTPSHGSSNKGINQRHANREEEPES